jgi:DNA relaxase NicK
MPEFDAGAIGGQCELASRGAAAPRRQRAAGLGEAQAGGSHWVQPSVGVSGWVGKVDYLQCRSRAEVPEVLQAVSALFAWTGEEFGTGPIERGKDGYVCGWELRLGGARVGRMDWGGEVMREWVRVVIEGTGCGYVEWRDSGSLQAIAQLRRCDPCVTFYDGSVTHERVQAAYRAGGFKCPGPGRPPKARIVMSDGDPWAGRTFYVGAPDKGQQKPHKFARCYEKGLEVLKREGRVPKADADPTSAFVDGWPARDVYRIEVEFNAQGHVGLNWSMVHDPVGFWRGAYPWLGQLLPGVERWACAPSRPAPGNDLDRLLEHIKVQFGPALFTAVFLAGGDMGAVMARVMGDRHCERLVRAGVLLGRGSQRATSDPLQPFAGVDRRASREEVEASIRDASV